MNLSSLDLMRSDCSSHFIRIMDEYGIPHDWIQFEITETVATEYNGSLKRLQMTLRQPGSVFAWMISAPAMRT